VNIHTAVVPCATTKQNLQHCDNESAEPTEQQNV